MTFAFTVSDGAIACSFDGAALRTVTVLVDDVLRPALDHAGLPPEAVGLVRSPDREGARALVSMPALVPLVILRGSGPSIPNVNPHHFVAGPRRAHDRWHPS